MKKSSSTCHSCEPRKWPRAGPAIQAGHHPFWIPALRFRLRSASCDPTSRCDRNDLLDRLASKQRIPKTSHHLISKSPREEIGVCELRKITWSSAPTVAPRPDISQHTVRSHRNFAVQVPVGVQTRWLDRNRHSRRPGIFPSSSSGRSPGLPRRPWGLFWRSLRWW